MSLESAGLGHVRPPIGTYGLYDFARLPPLPITLTGDFAWLAREPVQEEEQIGPEPGGAAEKYAELLAAEPLPREFATFLQTPSLHGRIRSHTACYLEVCRCAVPAPGVEGKLVRFLCDQQACGFWYLYLAPDGDHAVVTSATHYGAPDEWKDDGPDDPLIFVAESFEAFLYRYWLENEIAFGNDMMPAARAYIEAYRRA